MLWLLWGCVHCSQRGKTASGSFSKPTSCPCCRCQAHGEKHLVHHLHRFCSSWFRRQIPHAVFPFLVQQVVLCPGRSSRLAQHTAKDPGCKLVRTKWPCRSRGWQERFEHNSWFVRNQIKVNLSQICSFPLSFLHLHLSNCSASEGDLL